MDLFTISIYAQFQAQFCLLNHKIQNQEQRSEFDYSVYHTIGIHAVNRKHMTCDWCLVVPLPVNKTNKSKCTRNWQCRHIIVARCRFIWQLISRCCIFPISTTIKSHIVSHWINFCLEDVMEIQICPKWNAHIIIR